MQEMIDICDFAVGLSRQLYGMTIASERPGHRLTEQWHPLGPVGVITAFNFPVAVWAWNAMLGLVCGDPVVWKPSEKTPLSRDRLPGARAAGDRRARRRAAGDFAVWSIGGARRRPGAGRVAEAAARLGDRLACRWAARSRKRSRDRLGRSLLELGGNNGMIVAPSADLELAVRAIVFAAAGTCGQRCTTLRRLIVHESIADELRRPAARRFTSGCRSAIRLRDGVLVGPLIDEARGRRDGSGARRQRAQQGGTVHGGGRVTDGVPAGGCLRAAGDRRDRRRRADRPAGNVRADSVRHALPRRSTRRSRIHNDVPQGLSSAILTSDVREAERFCSPAGSDCGIVNVNIGTSGAEIGGAFGGEKETGGGRESGSDAWKAYMRRVTNTVNYSDDLPLAQGIRFDVGP